MNRSTMLAHFAATIASWSENCAVMGISSTSAPSREASLLDQWGQLHMSQNGPDDPRIFDTRPACVLCHYHHIHQAAAGQSPARGPVCPWPPPWGLRASHCASPCQQPSPAAVPGLLSVAIRGVEPQLVSCRLWAAEAKVSNRARMEPITGLGCNPTHQCTSGYHPARKLVR